MTLSGIEAATFQLVEECLSRVRYCMIIVLLLARRCCVQVVLRGCDLVTQPRYRKYTGAVLGR
jgi:hypothetical protein